MNTTFQAGDLVEFTDVDGIERYKEGDQVTVVAVCPADQALQRGAHYRAEYVGLQAQNSISASKIFGIGVIPYKASRFKLVRRAEQETPPPDQAPDRECRCPDLLHGHHPDCAYAQKEQLPPGRNRQSTV